MAIVLINAAAHISLTKRRAIVAECDVLNRYATVFPAAHAGAIFSAYISGVARAGCLLLWMKRGLIT